MKEIDLRSRKNQDKKTSPTMNFDHRRHLPVFALVLLLGAPFATGEQSASAEGAKPLFTAVVRTTAYTHTEADHLAYGTKNAFGTGLSYTPEYHSVRQPTGRSFRWERSSRSRVMTGSSSSTTTAAHWSAPKLIDLYFPDRKRMNNWGSRIVNIEVLELGSFQTSFRVLAERGKHPHCLKMMASLMKVDWNQPRVRR